MQITTSEILEYIEAQKNTFERLGTLLPGNVFNDGIIEGLNLMKQYITIREENKKEGGI